MRNINSEETLLLFTAERLLGCAAVGSAFVASPRGRTYMMKILQQREFFSVKEEG